VSFDPNRPGLYPGLSYESYLSVARTNISKLKEMARSPLHYQYRLEHDRETTALSLGRSAHTAVLEPAKFISHYALWDERTESGKVRPRRSKDWDAFCAANAGKTIIKADECNFARAIRDAVHGKRVAEKYLAAGEPEVTMLWDDVETGRPCKGRLDWVTHVEGVDCLVGLKTARDPAARAFSNQAAKLLYHLQWAFYYDGYSLLTGKEPRVVELVVESGAPHDVVCNVIPVDVLELGREEYRALLARLAECETSKRWPGMAENEVMFELPAYLKRDDDEDLDDLELEGAARSRAVDALNEGL